MKASNVKEGFAYTNNDSEQLYLDQVLFCKDDLDMILNTHSSLRVEADFASHEDLCALFCLLPSTNIRELYLDIPTISSDTVVELAHILPQTAITHLTLNFNNVGGIGERELIDILPNTSVCVFDIL